MSFYSRSKNTDQQKEAAFYEEVDSLSQPLRNAAIDLANFFSSLENKTDAVDNLILRLNKMGDQENKLPIQEFDNEMDSIRMYMLSLAADLVFKKQFASSMTKETLEAMNINIDSFNKKIGSLVEKTDEIHKKHYPDNLTKAAQAAGDFVKRLGAAAGALIMAGVTLVTATVAIVADAFIPGVKGEKILDSKFMENAVTLTIKCYKYATGSHEPKQDQNKDVDAEYSRPTPGRR